MGLLHMMCVCVISFCMFIELTGKDPADWGYNFIVAVIYLPSPATNSQFAKTLYDYNSVITVSFTLMELQPFIM